MRPSTLMAFDLSIRDALLVDGSGAPARVADVHVQGKRIARIGPGPSGRREIAAEGRALAPGFVDVHAHDDGALLSTPDMHTPPCNTELYATFCNKSPGWVFGKQQQLGA